MVDDGQQSLLTNIPLVRGSRPSTTAVKVRENLKSYVNSMEGSVPWQWEHGRSRGRVRQSKE